VTDALPWALLGLSWALFAWSALKRASQHYSEVIRPTDSIEHEEQE
jgi:hypothetical protein